MLNESTIAQMVTEEITKQDLLKFVKNDKDFEKRVREIVSEIIIDMYRILWQHNNLFRALKYK